MKEFFTLKKILYVFIILLISTSSYAQKSELRNKLQDIVDAHNATIGFSFLDLQSGDTLTINGGKHLPMQSVYKFHLALAILNQVDRGELQLNQKIFIKKTDLVANTWSPIREKYPNGDVSLTLADILAFTVSLSDNIGCDILFQLIGGPVAVDQYIHSIGIEDVAIAKTESEMHQDEQAQFTNWSTPSAATDLLKLFCSGTLLSKKSNQFLWKIMSSTSRGSTKIRGLLPQDTAVAHKTGNSGSNKSGLTAASNDIGIITLPNGKQFAVAVFVSMTKEDEKTIDSIIAKLTKTSWDYMIK